MSMKLKGNRPFLVEIIKMLVVSQVVSLALLITVSAYNRNQLAKTRTHYSIEAARLALAIEDLMAQRYNLQQEISRIQSSPPKLQARLEDKKQLVLQQSNIIDDEMSTLQELMDVYKALINTIENPEQRIDLEIERYVLILDAHEAGDDSEHSLNDSHYFLTYREDETMMRETLQYYRRIRSQTDAGLPFQNPFAAPNGWTGSQVLVETMNVPLIYLLMAISSLLPANYLTRIFELGTSKALLLALNRHRFGRRILMESIGLMIISFMSYPIILCFTHTVINGFGSLQHLFSLSGRILSYAAYLCQRLPSLLAIATQLFLILAFIGFLTHRQASSTASLLVVFILHTFFRTIELNIAWSPMIYFEQESLYSVERGTWLWFITTIALLSFMIYRGIIRYQLRR